MLNYHGKTMGVQQFRGQCHGLENIYKIVQFIYNIKKIVYVCMYSFKRVRNAIERTDER